MCDGYEKIDTSRDPCGVMIKKKALELVVGINQKIKGKEWFD